MKVHFIGIDIGGTKTSISLADSRGSLLNRKVLTTQIGKAAQRTVHDIFLAINDLLGKRKLNRACLKAIGIGVPGPVDPRKQRIEKSPNLPGWEGIPLRSILNRRFQCPVFIENDANAAALGEKYFGRGRKVLDFVYITVSTGIGSGIIAGGKLVRGAGGAAGEIGHMTISINGEKCPCGKRGCVEAYASGTAITHFARRALRGGARSLMRKNIKSLSEISGTTVSQAAMNGDRLAIQIRRRAADYLGVAIGNLINILNPRLVILGGGVLTSSKHFWDPMIHAVKQETWPIAFKSCKIVRTKLGDRVGDFGAVAVAMERLKG